MPQIVAVRSGEHSTIAQRGKDGLTVHDDRQSLTVKPLSGAQGDPRRQLFDRMHVSRHALALKEQEMWASRSRSRPVASQRPIMPR
jgi:hypothetical protein